MTDTQAAWLTPLVEQAKARFEQWTDYFPRPDGAAVRVRLDVDDHTSLVDDEDWPGRLEWPRGDRRPDGFTGAARKLQTRCGPIWWQPPTDATQQHIEFLCERVQGYFLEDWFYLGMRVEVQGVPCPCCGERKSAEASLWAVESDSSVAYLVQVAEELLDELN